MDTGDGAADARTGDDDAHQLSAYLLRRRGEIGERIRQLAERGRELADQPKRDPSGEELRRAREHLARAQEHASDAHERAAEQHDMAGEAHLRAAALLDECGSFELARRHRDAAAADIAAGEADRYAMRNTEPTP